MSVEFAKKALLTAYKAAVAVPVPSSPVIGYKFIGQNWFTDLLLPVPNTPLRWTTGGVATATPGAGFDDLKFSNNQWTYSHTLEGEGDVTIAFLGTGLSNNPSLVSWPEGAVVEEVKAAQNIQTQWENQVLHPRAGKPWNQVHFVPNNPVPVTCGADGEDEFTGFLQVTCCVPAGTGDNLLQEQIDLILNAFKTGSKFTYGGQEVMVTSTGRAGGVPAEEWYKTPVTIFFLARHNRNTPT